MRMLLAILISLMITKLSLFASDLNQELSDEKSHAVVFMYHRFGDDRYPSTNIKLEQFEQQLDYIEKNGFNVWPLSKIVRYLLENKKLPDKTVALTIDDAYITTFTEGYPRLRAKKFPFTVFVSTHPVDTGSKNYMSWEQMREMSRYGAEFANHSLTHPFLLPHSSETRREWKSRVIREIELAQRKLYKELGSSMNKNPKLFSYPFGEYNYNIMKILQELKYVGVTQTSGVISSDTDLRVLPRFAMAEAYADIDDFILKINTLPLPVKSVSPIEPIVTNNNPPILRIRLQRHIENIQCYISSGERINVEWISNTEFQIEANSPLKAPRDRYTCTAPAKNGRWYWHSNLLIIR